MENNFGPALDLIEHFEGCVLHAYRDVVGVLTIGYGTTGPEVHPGMVITKDQAVNIMMADVEKLATEIQGLVKVSLNNNQLCALISFAYNLGIKALQHSTLLRLFNESAPILEVADEFLKWVHAGGKVYSGLVTRRKAERALFLSAQIQPLSA